MANWTTISTAGGVGSYVPPPDAPNILDDGTTVSSVYWDPYGHDWKRGLTGVLHLPTADVAYPHLFKIEVRATLIESPIGTSISAANQKVVLVQTLYNTNFSGTTITFKGDSTPVPIPFPSEKWRLAFVCLNDVNHATATPTFRDVSVSPSAVSSATAVETGPRFNQNVGRALATTATVTPTLSFNPGGSGGMQYVTIWTVYDWGDGNGVQTTWKGWYTVTGTSSGILLDGENLLFVTLLASVTVTIRVAIGVVDKNATIPVSAATATFTMAGPTAAPSAGNWINSANFTGLSSQLRYFSRGGVYSYMFGNLVYTATFSTHPSLKSTRCFVQNGKWNGSTWTADPTDNLEHAFVDGQISSEDPNTKIVVSGDSVTIIPKWPWEMSISTYAYPDNRIHIEALSADGSSVIQAAFTGSTSPCSEIIFSSDGQYAYIQPSITKALATAVPWDAALLGNRILLVSNKLQVAPSLAPDLVSATAVPAFSIWANASVFSLSGVITVDDGNPNWGQTAVITATAYGPTAVSGQEIARLSAPFTVSAHHVTWTGEQGTFLQAATSEGWTVVFTAYDTLGWAAPNPVTATVTVNAASVASVSISEISPRYQDGNQGILTRLSAVTTMGNGGQVPQNVTYWLSRDGGTTKVNQGWVKVTSSPQTVTLPDPERLTASGLFEGYYVPNSNANETWIIYAAAGAFTDLLPPGTAAVSNSLTVNKIGIPSANGVTNASASAAQTVTDGLGLPNWTIPSVTWTDPDITHSTNTNYDINAWFTVLTFQCTDSLGNPPVGDPTNSLGGLEVEIARFPVLGAHLQQAIVSDGTFGFNPPGTAFHYACLRIYTVNRLSTNSWQDSTNAVRQNCWAGGQPRLLVDFGQIPNNGNLPAQPFAPNVTSPTATVNFVTEGQLPKWNLSGTVTLPSPFTGIKRIHITAIGLGELIAIPSASFGIAPFTLVGNVLSYITSPNIPRDTVTHNYTVAAGAPVQFWVENSDGVLTGSPPSIDVVVTGTAAPFTGNAPLPPTIATASTPTVTFTRDGHNFDFALSGIAGTSSFTAPSNPGGGTYTVRVTKISPTGVRNIIDVLQGPFTAGLTTNCGWAGDFSDIVPATSQVWKIGYMSINSDNVAATELQVSVTVAPNLISSVTGAEGVRFTEAGGGAKSHAVLTPTVTSTNAPGFGVGPQTITVYFSADNGVTWFGLDWVDLTSSGIAQTFEVWRPVSSSLTQCKVAAVIGAFAWIPGNFNGTGTTGPNSDASLTALGAVRSSIFTLAVVGAPLASGVTGAVVNARTASGPALYNEVVIGKTGDGVVFWGLPDGISYTNPTSAIDPDFWYSILELHMVNSTGTAAPTEAGGVVRGIQGPLAATPGASVLVTFNYFEFQTTANAAFDIVHLEIICYSRSGQRTLQATCWSGVSFKNVLFGTAPASSIVATLTAANSGQGITVDSGGHINVKVSGSSSNLISNPGFETGSVSPWEGGIFINSGSQHSGSFCGQLLASGAFTAQHIPIGVGVSVTFSAFMNGVGTSASLNMFIRFEDASQNILSQTNINIFTSGVYQQQTISLTSGAGTTQVAIGFIANSGAGSWFIDDASLIVPGSGSVGLDANGNLTVPPLSIQSTNLAAQSLSDLSKYSSTVRAVEIRFGEPSTVGLPNTTYPSGAVIFDTSVGTYKALVFDSATSTWKWKSAANASDIIAGNLAAGVIYGGTINANKINAGQMAGVSLVLNLGGITTSINNNFDFAANGNVGFKCQDNTNLWYTSIDSVGYRNVSGSGQAVAQMLYQQTGNSANPYAFLLLSGFGTSAGNSVTLRSDSATVRLIHPTGGEIRLWYNGGFANSMYMEVRDNLGNNMIMNSKNIIRNGVTIL